MKLFSAYLSHLNPANSIKAGEAFTGCGTFERPTRRQAMAAILPGAITCSN